MIPKASFSVDEIAFLMAGVSTELIEDINKSWINKNPDIFDGYQNIADFNVETSDTFDTKFDADMVGWVSRHDPHIKSEYPALNKLILADKNKIELIHHIELENLDYFEFNARKRIRRKELIRWANEWNIVLWFDEASSSPQTIEQQKIKHNITAAQSDMIAALLELLPELKRNLDKDPNNAPYILLKYMNEKGVTPLNLGENNYKNWMKKVTYKNEKK